MSKRTPFPCLLAITLAVCSCKKSDDPKGGDTPPKTPDKPAGGGGPSGLGSTPSTDTLEAWTNRYRAIEDEPQRFEFIAEMVATDDDDELPARISLALDDASPRIRREAMGAVSAMEPQQSYGLLMKAIGDSDDFVRDYALGDIRRLPDEMKLDAYRTGLYSEHGDVKDKSIRSLANHRTPKAFGYLLEGLKDESPEVREAVNLQTNALVEQRFESYPEAEAWWSANKNRYDDRLLSLD